MLLTPPMNCNSSCVSASRAYHMYKRHSGWFFYVVVAGRCDDIAQHEYESRVMSTQVTLSILNVQVRLAGIFCDRIMQDNSDM
jgi:hypothetical protein